MQGKTDMEENKTMSIEEVLESEGKYVGLTRGVADDKKREGRRCYRKKDGAA